MISELLKWIAETICNKWPCWWEGNTKKDNELAGGILTASIVIVLAILGYFMKSRKGVGSLPPGPRGLPIVGYIPFLGTNLHEQFTELANHYGPIYKLWLGNKLCVVMSSSFLAKEVVRNQDTVFANRDPPVAALIGTYGGLDIAWSPYGSYWRKIRKLFVREMLSNTNLEASYNLRRAEVRKAIGEVYTKIDSPMDIGQLTFSTELNVVLSMLWGSRKIKSNFGAEFREVVKKMIELLGKPNISDFFPMLARFDIQGVERKMKGLLQCVDKILDTVIDTHNKLTETSKLEGASNNEGNKDFLQILLELKEEGSATAINVTQIKAILLVEVNKNTNIILFFLCFNSSDGLSLQQDVVVGGTDTTVTLVEWVMAEIMRHPEVMKKIQDELTEVVGMNNIVEEFHIPKLQYLDAVVKETFRLHPPLPLLVPRCPSESCMVGGYSIPKGTKIFLNVWAIQRDPQFWDSPSEFKPERFLNDTSATSTIYDYSGNNFNYLPFGSGRRMCAGIPLAEKMAIYVLASFLHSFEWHLPKGEEVDILETFGIVMKKRTPLIAIPSQRLSRLDLYT